jgi:hypothetical protein
MLESNKLLTHASDASLLVHMQQMYMRGCLVDASLTAT